jgi:hypothetical protein
MNVRSSVQPITDWLQGITVYDLIKTTIKVAPVVGAIWAWGVPYLNSQAAEFLTEQLIQQGLDPQKFREVPEIVQGLKAEAKDIQQDLATIKEHQRQLIELLGGTPRKTER